jgi:hypothetical protein
MLRLPVKPIVKFEKGNIVIYMTQSRRKKKALTLNRCAAENSKCGPWSTIYQPAYLRPLTRLECQRLDSASIQLRRAQQQH